MAKKKKTQLKPVPRGVATTSVPKKIPQAEQDQTVEPQANSPDEGHLTKEKTGEKGDPDTTAPVPSDELDLDGIEEQALQSLVDKIQEKTEKETLRTVKGINLDRRFSRSLPRLELDSRLIDKIITLILESEIGDSMSTSQMSTSVAPGKKRLEESEDKAIARLGITYGVLRRLGYSELRVEECLRAISGVDLDEAYEWLCLHCSEQELEGSYPSETIQQKDLSVVAKRASRAPQSPSQFLASASPKGASKPLSATAPDFVPSRLLVPYNVLDEEPLNAERSDFTDRSLPVSINSSRSMSGSGRSSPEIENPTLEYSRLKLQYDNLSLNRHSSNESKLHEIRQRLDIIKNDYFFDENEARAAYKIERDKAATLSLQDRLRGIVTPGSKQPKTRPSNLQQQNPKPPMTKASCDIFEDNDDDSVGGLLEILDDIPATETNSQGTTINIRNMALPKHWSGRTPKTLLKELVAKSDRYAAVTYVLLSGLSRAKRSGLSIRWDGKKMDEWRMEDIACHDEEQAEQYIATVALHALTFPPTDGFAAGNSATLNNQTFFRSLPAVFRELWDELEIARKIKDDSINRNLWARLRSIIQPKLETSYKTEKKIVKSTNDLKHRLTNQTSMLNNEVTSEQLAASFLSRQASTAYQDMLIQRNSLPISQYRQKIIDTLENSQVVVLSGETGCGKSTQVPTFILEDQLSRGKSCKIYCTEPRRISAISLAQRVSRELGDPPNAVGTLNSLVGYSIRLESNTSRNTRLAFVTNGIALRMLEGGTGRGGHGVAFDEITHIIIDEVHERTIESDFLLIVLKSLIEQRPDLKVVLMSATVDAEKISDFFGGCPTLHVPGRTFPVDVQFLEDAVEYTGWSITDSSPYARRPHDKFYRGKNRPDWVEEISIGEDDEDGVEEKIKLEKRYSSGTAAVINIFDERLIPYELIIRLLERICFEDPLYFSYSSAVLIFMPGLAEIRRLNDILTEHPRFGFGENFKIYPLHSTLSNENQSAVFDIPPTGIRKIVIATNIAETGITIPDITCVIDSGKHREMRFDEKRQISRLVETFIARSNAAQRRGRAGRVQRGLCFHLFTKLRHDTQMADHPLPEMMRLSLSDLALRIKIMKVELGSSIEDVLSRALDPPVSINVQRAISMLVEVRALTPSEEITPMGRILSKLPTDVHLGKFLLTATLFRCLDPALTIAAALNSKSPFVSPFGLEQEAKRAKNSFRTENSDFLTIHNAFASWRRASANSGFIREFCRTNYLSHQNLQQIEELRQQFLGYLIDSSFIQVDRAFVGELSRARYSRNRTRFVTVPSDLDVNSNNSAIVNAALTAGLFPKILAMDWGKGQMKTITNNQQTYTHPSSINFGKRPAEFGVNHLAYFTLMHSKKLYAWETGPVDDIALALLCGECDFKPISNTISIDRKIKFQVSSKANVAMKFLRTQLNLLLAQQFQGKSLTETQVLWNDISMIVLGKMKVEDEKNGNSISLSN